MYFNFSLLLLSLAVLVASVYLSPQLCFDLYAYWFRKDGLQNMRGYISPYKAVTILWLLIYGGSFFVLSFVKIPNDIATSPVIHVASVSRLIAAVIALTSAEELVFRGVPLFVGWIARKLAKIDISWGLGLIFSLAFGLVHLTNYENPGFASLPYVLPQIWMGFLFWYLAKKYGLHWTVLLHLVINLPIMLKLALA